MAVVSSTPCGCGGGNCFIHPLWVEMVSSTPCGVAVVVGMVSSTHCGVAAALVMVSSTPCGVAVVEVMVVVVMLIRLHCHVEVLGARLTST